MAEAEAVATLSKDVRGAIAIITHVQQALTQVYTDPSTPVDPASSSSSSEASQAGPPSSLDLAVTSATLIHAHATKISLLITTPPFTASALSKVVRELTAGPVAALAAAVQICDPNKYTATFRRELAWRSNRVAKELQSLLEAIPRDGKGRTAAEEKFGGKDKDSARGSIASTGVLWSACDDLKKLAGGGVGGFFIKKVNEWKATLEDVLEEMKEWSEEEPDDDDDSDDDNVQGLTEGIRGTSLDPQDILDDMLNSHGTIPRSDPQKIRPRLSSSLRRLRQVILFYSAFTKRRLTVLPALPVPPATREDDNESQNIASRLDEISVLLQRIPDHFNNLQCAFYELNSDDIDKYMDNCFFDAFAASELSRPPWENKETQDAFWTWVGNFHKAIKEA